ncbi:competence/damage-inducible protein A [Clostridium polynesiense]|uniref:competence/damage-inducible protein A n=1 Tax=Clostridium polynesiense TaxID=1325933 RepID=UPI0005900ED0|nr:competence/damage-inducible protein A [Clostridium polynesiense]
MKAEIVAVGTELLLGDIVNTNAQYLSRELAALGISVYRQTVVGDNEERLLATFKDALSRCDLVITTGGLGPTDDDITKEIAAKFFNKELVFHEESWELIKGYFNKMEKEPGENNRKQAYFPKDAIILKNNNGTAPGAILKDEENNKTIIVLPGPPAEMERMFKESVFPYLKRFRSSVFVSKVLRIAGIGESEAADKIKDILQGQTNPTIAPYAKQFDTTFRITASAESEEKAEEMIKPVEKQIRDRLGENVYGEGEVTMEEVVAKLLIDKNLTISVAESCTGGLLASRLINYPGISQVFVEGAVTYSNEAKMRRLGVKESTLEKYGAVSEETAREMAEGIAREAGTDIGVSTTGIAGPGGGTEEKPVGLVYAGLCINGVTKVKKLNYNGSRERIRNRTTAFVLDWIRRELL